MGSLLTSTDVSEPADSVHTLSLQPAVAQHLYDLRILLTVLLEHEFTLLVVGFVLSPAPVLATLFCVITVSYAILHFIFSSEHAVLPVMGWAGASLLCWWAETEKCQERRGRGRGVKSEWRGRVRVCVRVWVCVPFPCSSACWLPRLLNEWWWDLIRGWSLFSDTRWVVVVRLE